jgi:hypothetical protein
LTASLACEQCTVANCASCATEIGKCDYSATVNNCNNGFFFLNDTCAACENGCRLCDNDGQCQACNTSAGFYMWLDMQCFRAVLVTLSLVFAVVVFGVTL